MSSGLARRAAALVAFAALAGLAGGASSTTAAAPGPTAAAPAPSSASVSFVPDPPVDVSVVAAPAPPAASPGASAGASAPAAGGAPSAPPDPSADPTVGGAGPTAAGAGGASDGGGGLGFAVGGGIGVAVGAVALFGLGVALKRLRDGPPPARGARAHMSPAPSPDGASTPAGGAPAGPAAPRALRRTGGQRHLALGAPSPRATPPPPPLAGGAAADHEAAGDEERWDDDRAVWSCRSDDFGAVAPPFVAGSGAAALVPAAGARAPPA